MSEDWPENIQKPELPKGYSWVCLRRCPKTKFPSSEKWWIRMKKIYRGPHRTTERMVKMRNEYFDTPEDAIRYCVAFLKP